MIEYSKLIIEKPKQIKNTSQIIDINKIKKNQQKQWKIIVDKWKLQQNYEFTKSLKI